MISLIIQILTEPGFKESSWGKAIFEGLIVAINKKKLKYSSMEDIQDIKNLGKFHYLILIGSDEKWLSNAISHCSKIKVHPILLSSVPRTFSDAIYSSVTSDIEKSMYYLLLPNSS